MNSKGSKGKGPRREIKSPAEHKLQLKADEILEIARCARSDEKRELVLDVLRSIEAVPAVNGPERYTSGFMSNVANRKHAACACCGAVRKIYRRLDMRLCCADCVLDDMIAAQAR